MQARITLKCFILLTLNRLGGGGGMVKLASKERVKPWFFVTFNIIMVTSFLKISLKFLKSFRRYEDFLCQY